MEFEKSSRDDFNYYILITNLIMKDIMIYFYCIEQILINWVYRLNDDDIIEEEEYEYEYESSLSSDFSLNEIEFPSDIDIDNDIDNDIDIDFENSDLLFDDEIGPEPEQEPQVPSSIIIQPSDRTQHTPIIEEILRNHFESME